MPRLYFVLLALTIASAFIASLYVGGVFGPPPAFLAPTPSVASGPDRFDAEVICEKFVTDALKAPSTAHFSPDPTATNVSNDVWRVTGWVDAQNGFGAQIRNTYDCRVRYTGKTGTTLNWVRENLNITPR